MIKRTKYCGQISQEDLDKEVVLCGWVHRVRNHGGVVFIDLRDRGGGTAGAGGEGAFLV